MAGHSDSESENSFLDEAEFEENESEILLSLSNGGIRFHGCGEGTFVCPFYRGKKVPSWSLHELLQHANGKSRRGEGISRPEHSALAKSILSNDAMAHDRELGGVGDCGGNEAVKACRDQRQTANRADKEARKEKVLKK
jgi:GNAT superfamily N-acetyltransferase